MTEFIGFFFPLPKWWLLILSGLLLFLGSLVVYHVKDYIKASKEFRDTIYTELEGLYPTPTKWPENSMEIIYILKGKYPRIEIAVHKFKGHLPTFLAKRFNKAWIKYYSEHEQEDWQCYYHYVPFSGKSFSNGEKISEYDNTKTYKDNFKKNVNNLLKYARQI